MMDIVTEKELNLKNITQIGTPNDREKIYIEDFVYTRIHMEEYEEKRVFILMGHTTCAKGEYTIFVEEALPVQNIMFSNNTPIWTNRTWSEMFREIRRSYEDYIIVGWALDLKGAAPAVTPELESIHREHFGGTRQLLFLLDTGTQEEYFYYNKNNHLYRKKGFYIYHNTARKRTQEMTEDKSFLQGQTTEPETPVRMLPTGAESMRRVRMATDTQRVRKAEAEQMQRTRRAETQPQRTRQEETDTEQQRRTRRGEAGTQRRTWQEETEAVQPQRTWRQEADAEQVRWGRDEVREEYSADAAAASARGRYREMLLEQQKPPRKKKEFSFGTLAVVVLLFGVIGTALYKNPEQLDKIKQLIPAVGEQAQETFQNLGNDLQSVEASDRVEESSQTSEKTQADDTEEQGKKIPVETVDGDIPE